MKEIANILIVDSYPMVLIGYEQCLKDFEDSISFNVVTAHTIPKALQTLNERTSGYFNIILLDIDLKSRKIGTVHTGEDLGKKIRSDCPQTKIIALTENRNCQRLRQIVQNIAPKAFFLKTELNGPTLCGTLQKVLAHKEVLGEKLKKIMEIKRSSSEGIDLLDYKILYYISIGEKMKDLPEHIPLSMPSIERRKRKMKMLLGVPEGSNRQLLDEAKERGFI